MKCVFFSLAIMMAVDVQAFVNCFGKINNVYLHKNGGLTIHPTWKDGCVTVCSVKSDWKGISPEICKGWLSIAMTAQVSGSETVMQYGTLENCKDVGSYGDAVAPNYLMLYGSER